jgi:membrane-bound ClpP family serine protease
MTRQIGIYGDIIMEKKLQGIALILFGIMLLLISMHSPWIPIIGTDYTDLALWIGIILGIVGFVFVFRKER